LRKAHDLVEDLRVEVTFEGDTLYKTRAVTNEQKYQFALVSAVVDPALDGYFFFYIIRNF
jgi:hypothetical protein